MEPRDAKGDIVLQVVEGAGDEGTMILERGVMGFSGFRQLLGISDMDMWLLRTFMPELVLI